MKAMSNEVAYAKIQEYRDTLKKNEDQQKDKPIEPDVSSTSPSTEIKMAVQ